MRLSLKSAYDVVIVGGGGAGLAAGLAAAQAGATVVVLEKNRHLGGTTAIAVGSYTAARTSLQRASQIVDDPLDHDADMARFAGSLEVHNNSELRRQFAHWAGETFEWLRSLGLEFHGPSPEPPNRVPRMHNVVPNARAYIATMKLQLDRLGGEVVCDFSASELLRDSNGDVVGVTGSRQGKSFEVRARKGVILATGDYSSGLDLKRRYLPSEIADIEGINPTSTGDGHRMGEFAGGQLCNMEVVYGPEIRFVPPPRKPLTQLLPASPRLSRLYGMCLRWLPRRVYLFLLKQLLVTWQHPEPTVFREGGVLINKLGERFVDEMSQPERTIARQPGQIGYIVFDAEVGKRLAEWPNFISTAPKIAYAYLADYKRDRPDIYWQGMTLAALARKLDLSVETLESTVRTYNACARGESVDRQGRTTFGPPLTQPPFVALGPVKSYIVTAEGGLRVDDSMRVLDAAGRPVRGLFAAGSVGMGGLILWGHGLHIAWAMTSGRLAGNAAAQSADLGS